MSHLDDLQNLVQELEQEESNNKPSSSSHPVRDRASNTTKKAAETAERIKENFQMDDRIVKYGSYAVTAYFVVRFGFTNPAFKPFYPHIPMAALIAGCGLAIQMKFIKSWACFLVAFALVWLVHLNWLFKFAIK